MRSNSLDFSSFESMNTPIIYKKTERSHEENQERAYIAASRRTDRSLEARVQSARMASEIHKKRTGKTFRITEEIVLNEEMYEEEDDDLPRSYRVLSSGRLQSSTSDTNNRAEVYLSSRVALSTMLARTNDEWRQNDVNQRFAALFPQHATFDTPRPASTMSPSPRAQQPQLQQALFPPRPRAVSQQYQDVLSHSESFTPTSTIYNQQHSSAQLHSPEQQHSPAQHDRAFSAPSGGQYPLQHPNFLRQDSGVGLTASPTNFGNSPTNFGNSPTNFGNSPNNFGNSPLAVSPMELGSNRSAFTSELPPEARMMMLGGAGMNSDYEPAAPGNWPNMDGSYSESEVPRGSKSEEETAISPNNEGFDATNLRWDQMMQPMDDSTWNTFINDNAWADGQ
ncbi:hypothetical protein CCM_06133 [Cordyceps militaris CM01]|uniref:Uncharacterized protein n=1 Tax=Cordyceps militaris (strain CM01) TaxID=983644 RepID=G3JIX9_CORMM|nr:uncharacterized protein CCM_06133 [Cordyceps militaris CM01]EGX91973.1 hypothetical protein CCM_06133 [Cordyceps militaris CM01]